MITRTNCLNQLVATQVFHNFFSIFDTLHWWNATKVTFYFSIRVFFTDTDDSQDSRGREGTIFYSTLPLPPAHEHSDIYLQLCMWDDYHVFLIATLVFTRLLLDEIYHLIELPFEWLIELTSTITLVLKANCQPSVLVTQK